VTPLRGGEILDTPEKLAWASRNGPEHVRTCAGCGLPFYSPRLASDVCHGCWYGREMEDAAVRFRPLSEELERLLEVGTSVDQTGGMVMCLRVPIGRETCRGGETLRWAWFAELGGGEYLGVGLYDARADEDEMPEGEYVDWPDEHVCGAGPCSWYHHPELARAVAAWAAPIIVEFATREAP
jgi:hypothetical protein